MPESLNCNNSGTPLEVPAGANYITCTHCGTHLAVRRSESVLYTEKIDQIDQRTQEIAEQVSRLTAQQRLDELDRQWAVQQVMDAP